MNKTITSEVKTDLFINTTPNQTYLEKQITVILEYYTC